MGEAVPPNERLNRLLIAYNYRDALPLAQDPTYDVNSMAPHGVTALYHLSSQPDAEDLADSDAVVDALLARQDIDVNKTEENDLSPLMSAIDDMNWSFARKLLARPDINVNHVYVDRRGNRSTALDVAYLQLEDGGEEAQEVVDTLETKGAQKAQNLPGAAVPGTAAAEAAAAEGRRREAELDAAVALHEARIAANTSEAGIGNLPTSPAESSEELPKEEEEALIGKVPKGGRKTRRKARKTAKKKTAKARKTPRARKGGRRTRRVR